MFFKIFICTLFSNAIRANSLPQESFGFHKAVENFHNAVQQQTFQSVLISIEERLRNLDNIYSMHLSETLKSKLDQYHRKLESLDLKIIRLESMVMLNLDKISENISTKTYKDDIALTQTYRKLDNMYDGLSHRVNYMEKKSDMALDKLQNKIDTVLLRLEKMEENMVQRNSDIEAELSETLFVIEDFKSSSTSTEQSLLNMTNFLKQAIHNGPLTTSMNVSIQNLMRQLNQTIIKRFEKLENTTSRNLNISETSNSLLGSMRMELKEDFNEYANKVADMSVDIWRRNDIADESLETIETVVNSTLIEVQNGVRSLMLQIGKLSGKGIMKNDKFSLESLTKSVNLSLEKIIASQELFLESCHRVQMDESQIESEISVILGKLIDMLEKKMPTVMKDLKTIEKSVKTHDSRTNRNLYQANTNIVSLFEKTTKISGNAEKQLDEIKFYINSLFTFVQDVLPKTVESGKNQEEVLHGLLANITSIMKNIKVNDCNNLKHLESNLRNQYNLSEKMYNQMQNLPETSLNNNQFDGIQALSNNLVELSEEMKKLVSKISSSYVLNGTGSINMKQPNVKRKNCLQDYTKVIDKRADYGDCVDEFDSLNNGDSSSNNRETELSFNNLDSQGDIQSKKTKLEIFGTSPTASEMVVFNDNEQINNDKQANASERKTFMQNNDHFIDMKADHPDYDEETVSSNKNAPVHDQLTKTILETFGTPTAHKNPILHENGQIHEVGLQLLRTTVSSDENITTNDNEQVQKTEVHILGSSQSSRKNQDNNEVEAPKNKTKCSSPSVDSIDVRADSGNDRIECNQKSKLKKIKNRKKTKSRLNDDDGLEYEDTTEVIDVSTINILTTTDIDINFSGITTPNSSDQLLVTDNV